MPTAHFLAVAVGESDLNSICLPLDTVGNCRSQSIHFHQPLTGSKNYYYFFLKIEIKLLEIPINQYDLEDFFFFVESVATVSWLNWPRGPPQVLLERLFPWLQ